MTTLDLKPLKKRGLTILRLSGEEWQELLNGRKGGARFTLVFPHDVARAAKAKSPVLVVIAGGRAYEGDWDEPVKVQAQLKLGWIKSIQAVATRDSRVSFDYLRTVGPRTLGKLAGSGVPAQLKPHIDRAIASKAPFTGLTPKVSDWFIDRVAAKENDRPALSQLLALLGRQTTFRNAVALEEDALTLALKAFGAKDAPATELALTQRTTALAGARLQEDVVIEHDARWMPGWTLNDSDLTGRAVFTQGDDELQVFTANKQPLERLFGVDLIYLNERQRAIVMVQYKMMDPEPRQFRTIETLFGSMKEQLDSEWTVPIDKQFKTEIARMKRFTKAIGGSDAYRMHASPFFFKLVRRNGATGNAGLLLSLEHLEHMMAGGTLTGPKGGLRISYNVLAGQYLRGETFVDVVRSGYVGSHSATTAHLEQLIKATLDGGRAVVAAIERTLPKDL